MTKYLVAIGAVFFTALAGAESNIDNMILGYQHQAGVEASLKMGESLWARKYMSVTGERSCATCHGTNLTLAGEHIKTHKAIKPMAPSVNSKRLGDEKKVNKWFKRNCKWTMGRECSDAEKAHILLFLSKQ